MSETLHSPRIEVPSAAPVSTSALGPSQSLVDRIARLSLQLAALLDHFEGVDFERGAGFLRAIAEAGEVELLARPGAAMLDRLTLAWSLSSLELDLLALALMPEQHEGYAGIFASLHPRSDPRPTLGLAAQLLAPGPVERLALGRVIDEGPARALGMLVCREEGPTFNRSLELGPGMTSLLQGGASWPAPLQPREDEPERVDALGLEHWLDQPATRQAIAALREQACVDVLVIADDLRSASERARVLAASAGLRSALFELDAESLTSAGASTLAQIRVHTIARARVAILAIEPGERERALPSWTDHPAPIIVCTTRGQSRARNQRPMLALECGRPDPFAARQVWASALPELAEQKSEVAATAENPAAQTVLTH